MTNTNNFCKDETIKLDLGIPANTNQEDALIQSLIKRANQTLANMLQPYAESMPYADASITADLEDCGNLLVEAKWHLKKSHFDDVRETKKDFEATWLSVVTKLKALPTTRLKPIAVAGSLATDSTLLQNIPGVTDSEGNVLSTL